LLCCCTRWSDNCCWGNIRTVAFPTVGRNGGITMNTTPRSPIVTNTRGHPSQFQQIITEKSENFVGREFVFAAINEFFQKSAHGYFTLIGAPGSGKTAILAKYVTENPHVIYYNAQVEGKNRADEFLSDICNQLINQYPHVGAIHELPLQPNITEGSWF